MAQTYNEADLETAMCLWEAMLDWLARDSTPPFLERKNRYGMASLRTDCMALIRPCDEAWQLAKKGGFDDSFDWEFCPWFLKNCVSWDDMQPRRDITEVIHARWPSSNEH